jgi:predicted outer membrane repeat protein
LEYRLVPSTLTVTSALDSGPGSLRDTVASANSGDTIVFDPSLSGQTIILASQIQLTQNLTIDGGANNITLSGGNTNRLFEVTSGVNDEIDNLTLTNGYVVSDGTNPGSGGAILSDSGSILMLNNDTFTNNYAAAAGSGPGYGGAIENDGTLTVNNSTFTGNMADTSGGAIDSYGGPNDTLTINNTVFQGNIATQKYGGAINSDDTINLTGDTFGGSGAGQGNSAGAGGGAIDAFGQTPGTTTLMVSSSTFTNNAVINSGYGGAISTTDILSVDGSNFTGNNSPYGGGAIDYYINNGSDTGYNSSMTLTNDTFANNASEAGGAVYSDVAINSGMVTVTVSGSLFNNNSATGNGQFFGYGGGLDIYHGTSGTGSASVAISNSTFFQNTSSDYGGGLSVSTLNLGTGMNTAALTSLTINQNSAGNEGGGLYVDPMSAAPAVDNSIIAGNSLTSGVASNGYDVFGVVSDQGYNLIGQTDGSSGFTASTDFTGTSTNPLDPGLASALADNGGPTQTLALSTSSPGYENGDPSLLGTQDQRGFTRTNYVSIGAYDPDAM